MRSRLLLLVVALAALGLAATLTSAAAANSNNNNRMYASALTMQVRAATDTASSCRETHRRMFCGRKQLLAVAPLVPLPARASHPVSLSAL